MRIIQEDNSKSMEQKADLIRDLQEQSRKEQEVIQGFMREKADEIGRLQDENNQRTKELQQDFDREKSALEQRNQERQRQAEKVRLTCWTSIVRMSRNCARRQIGRRLRWRKKMMGSGERQTGKRMPWWKNMMSSGERQPSKGLRWRKKLLSSARGGEAEGCLRARKKKFEDECRGKRR